MKSETVEVRGIEVEAAAWIAQLDAGQWSAADQLALREWCARSPAHRDALRRMCSTWTELDGLALLREAFDEHSTAQPVRLRWNRFWSVHAALFVVFCGVCLWAVLPRMPKLRPPAVELYTTNVGEQRTVVLGDRSKVRLNTNSLLEVSYRPEERRVRLVKGEALFEVAKDTSRPFVVNAAGTSIQAVGTRFAVRLKRDDVEVLVSEGSVTVGRTRASSNTSVVAKTNVLIVQPEQIALVQDRTTDPIHVSTVDTHEVEKRLAWTEGVLEFDGEPLEKVIAEVSRYTPLKITIADPELQHVPVGGRFKIGETRTLFDVIVAGFGARVISTPEGVVITRAPRGRS